MRSKKCFRGLPAVLAIFALTVLAASTCAVAQEKVLHSFNRNGGDGYQPSGGLIFDAAGNLYGTTFWGGAYNYGTVFELTPEAGGHWAEKVLHTFNQNGIDGFYPHAGLIFDAAGNLYGTTNQGGANGYKGGTVFELSPRAGGGWTESILHEFGNVGDGYDLYSALIFDSVGNLYGTTVEGGAGCGTVFELSPQAGGAWSEQVLHSFSANGNGDCYPYSTLILDASQNLYGTTSGGGNGSWGTVFELTPTGGRWAETILHGFKNSTKDGIEPTAGLIFDAFGNLYGTTEFDGAYGYGTVFELSPEAGGRWTERILHNFEPSSGDGGVPFASLIFDPLGNLYGTTVFGGIYGSNTTGGTVFELKPRAVAGWTGKILHSFGNGTVGSLPTTNLVFDAAGNLYGTTNDGGVYGGGTVFEITP